MREVLAGRREAYEELVRRWTPRVLAVCHAKVGRRGMSEDLAQEALLRGYVGLRTLSEPEKFGSWLHGIAVRTCLDWLKAKERTQVSFSDLGAPASPEEVFAGPDSGPASPSSAIEREDDVKQLLEEVEALPEEYRTVILLYYYDDVTYRDIAGMLGVSPATVNLRLTKARALLRRRLGALHQSAPGDEP